MGRTYINMYTYECHIWRRRFIIYNTQSPSRNKICNEEFHNNNGMSIYNLEQDFINVH